MRNTGSYGWFAIAAFAIAFDIAVMRKGKQSLSKAVWDSTQHPYYGPAITGLWAALTYHFFVDKPRIEVEVSNGIVRFS